MRKLPDLGRALALLLLFVAAIYLHLGADAKIGNQSPEPVGMTETIPNEIVIDLRDDASDQQIAELGRNLGIALRFSSPHSRESKLMVGTVDPARHAGVLQQLRSNKLVEGADPQYVYRLQGWIPNDPEYQRQWHLKTIGIEEAWTKTKGKGAVVAVIDSGVGVLTQQGYRPTQDSAQLAKGYDFVNNDDIPEDGHGHGTHVAGTIAEATNNGVMGAGIAPEATILPIRVADAGGAGKSSAVVDAIRYAADHGAHVVNMGLGGGARSSVEESAIQYAYRKKVTLIAAAGNNGKEGVSYPARFKECIAVSAVGPQGMITRYSTWGADIDIAAPGGDHEQGLPAGIWQNTAMAQRSFFGRGRRIDGWFSLQGTSMASPHVAGVAALLVSLGEKNPDEIRSILRKAAKPQAPANRYGAGLLDAAKAVQSVNRANRYDMLQIALSAGGVVLLLYFGGYLKKSTDPMFFAHRIAVGLALGVVLPFAVEKLFGFGSYFNLIGHSAAVPILVLLTTKMNRASLWPIAAFTFGVLLHLLLDADSGKTPLQVHPQSRITFWLYANIAVGAYFLWTGYRQTAAPAAVHYEEAA